MLAPKAHKLKITVNCKDGKLDISFPQSCRCPAGVHSGKGRKPASPDTVIWEIDNDCEHPIVVWIGNFTKREGHDYADTDAPFEPFASFKSGGAYHNTGWAYLTGKEKNVAVEGHLKNFKGGVDVCPTKVGEKTATAKLDYMVTAHDSTRKLTTSKVNPTRNGPDIEVYE